MNTPYEQAHYMDAYRSYEIAQKIADEYFAAYIVARDQFRDAKKCLN